MRRIALISTGGTIEKTYDERSGELSNHGSIVHRMLRRLRLEDVAINTVQLMHKDSLDLTDADRARIIEAVNLLATGGDDCAGVVVMHGTDTLSITGEMLYTQIPHPKVPIILTGAMRPYEMKRSDALQNLNEAIFATSVLGPGVYAVAHGRALAFPGVTKDRARGTFVPGPSAT